MHSVRLRCRRTVFGGAEARSGGPYGVFVAISSAGPLSKACKGTDKATCHICPRFCFLIYQYSVSDIKDAKRHIIVTSKPVT